MTINLFGFSQYFDYLERIDDREQRTVILSMCDKFNNAAKIFGLDDLLPMTENDLFINQTNLPIPELYFAEICIVMDDKDLSPSLETLRRVVASLGDLCDEFVRSFINSSAFVGVRLRCYDTQVRWSREGRS